MKQSIARQVLRGIGITQKKVCAPLHFYLPSARKSIPPTTKRSREEEARRLQNAIQDVSCDLSELAKRANAEVGGGAAQIFEIHRMLLSDEDLLDAMNRALEEDCAAETAIDRAMEKYEALLLELGDSYLSERAADLRDLRDQLCRKLSGESKSNATTPTDPYILVAEDLSPSETVRLDKALIRGFVTFSGSSGSHTAILARAMGIPALVAVGRIPERYDGETALLNAETGELILGADAKECREFEQRQAAEDRIAKEHETYLRSMINKPAVTRGGHKMMIYANVGDASEVSAALSGGAEGIGLLRSEFLYLGLDDYPSEEYLFSAYSDVAVQMEGKRTVIRTLDIGADKQIPYFALPKEENPALGFRAIRICLARREIFKTQLRAILRASAFGRISLMLPMIVSVAEVRESRQMLEECKEELRQRGEAFDAHIELGIMIETPAAAMMSEELAREVDFFSVGTNDLMQYTLAADRQNPALEKLCEENREPVLRLIAKASAAIHRTGGWIGICGEMAADLQLTQRFADLRIDELSVSAPYLLGVRGRVSECH